MNADAFLRRAGFAVFGALFFAYLFVPLVLMCLTAFNSSAFPRVSPWECTTTEWFDALAADTQLLAGLKNSIFIGLGVVALSVPIGLAGALMLTQVSRRARPFYYAVVISPILMPGIVLGISTVVFWDRLGTMFNADYDSIFYDGIFLTVIGQTTFISAYTMLIFISRLERFEPAQEEAALDLGATNWQSFRKILLPFLRPALFSAAVLAFLASFENYNTTVFTILTNNTLTTVLASKVRYGINPSISALAVAIVAITLIGAVIYEWRKRAEAQAAKAAAATAAGRAYKAAKIGAPGMAMIALIAAAGVGTLYFSATYDLEECKARIAEQKRALRQTEQYKRVFTPESLEQQPPEEQAPRQESSEQSDDGGGIFAPSNLRGEGDEKKPDSGGGIFAPSNLRGESADN
jgi:spermidine/putrescine transport system permease protein